MCHRQSDPQGPTAEVTHSMRQTLLPAIPLLFGTCQREAYLDKIQIVVVLLATVVRQQTHCHAFKALQADHLPKVELFE